MTAVFDDGRFGLSSNVSLFQNFTCKDSNAAQLTDCSLADACQSTCPNAIGLRCYRKEELLINIVINKLLFDRVKPM